MGTEFALIEKYFSGHDGGSHIALGVGDDCALVDSFKGKQLCITTDTLVEGQHFFAGTRPEYLGWRSLAVNVSDLATMGAKPRFFLLSLTLPDGNAQFVRQFAKGLFACAKQENMALIGGNMAKGPLSVTISAYGTVKAGTAMLRSNARPGDDIYVTGSLGLGGLYVRSGYGKLRLSDKIFARCYKDAFYLPSRSAFGRKLRKFSSCAIDISDGTVGDLRHILECSKVGAQLWLDKLPLHPVFEKQEVASKVADYERTLFAAFGGCDYELLFTAAPEQGAGIVALSEKLDVPVTKVGRITKEEELQLLYKGEIMHPNVQAFEHF